MGMPFETELTAPRRIAVVGGGISGLGAAHLLARDHSVTLYEAERRLGGHARTVMAGRRGDQPVDTGFIVFNRPNYPNLCRLFEELGVPIAPSDMSFGASFHDGRVEFGLRNVGAVVAQPSNLARPAFVRMLRDIFRFNAGAVAAADDPNMTVGELVEAMRLGPWFRDRYLLPLSGAIWSTPCQGVLDFPARALVRFFRNHALLNHTGQHRWLTVRGGSVEYVHRLQASLTRRGVSVRTGTAVAGVRRRFGGVEVRTFGGEWEGYDEVVMATHADDTLRLLSDATGVERTTLGRDPLPAERGRAARGHLDHAAPAAGLVVVELRRGDGGPCRPHRPDLLDEFSPADPDGRPAFRHTEYDAPDPRGPRARHDDIPSSRLRRFGACRAGCDPGAERQQPDVVLRRLASPRFP